MSEQNTAPLLTPCHRAPFSPDTETRGGAYLSYEAVVGYSCDAPGCWNSWDAQGQPIIYPR